MEVVHAARFSADINRLRATVRGLHGTDLVASVRREIERLPAAALVADDSQQYVAANVAAQVLTGYSETELLQLTVMDLTPTPNTEDGHGLWDAFVAQGGQRGEYELVPKAGPRQHVRYWAFADVAPGLFISLLMPVEPPGSESA